MRIEKVLVSTIYFSLKPENEKIPASVKERIMYLLMFATIEKISGIGKSFTTVKSTQASNTTYKHNPKNGLKRVISPNIIP